MIRALRLPSIPKELVGLAVRIGLTLLAVEVILVVGLRPASGTRGSFFDHLSDMVIMTLVSTPLIYFLIIRPFLAAMLNANSELQAAARTLDAALQAKNEQAEALASALARLKLQGLILDRLAILSETDASGVITQINDNFCAISGYAREELIGRTHALVNSSFHPKAFWREMFATLAKGEVWQGEVLNRSKDGREYWVHCINTAVLDGAGKLAGYMSLRMDITESKAAQARLVEQNVKLDAALAHMSQGLVMFDANQRLVMCNDKYAEMYGLPPHLSKPGTPLTDVINNHVVTGIYRDGMPTEYLPDRISNIARVKECMHSLSNGNSIAVVRSPMQTGGWVSTHEDITHRLRLEERIAHLAMHDGLTDLPNRMLLRERFQQALAARHGMESTAVLYLDLDRFKQVNDTFGHAVGDALLKAVSDRINSCVRKTDTVARIGGDEFIVVQSSADPDEEAAALAERLIKRVSLPYVLAENNLEIGVSIGIAVAPRDGADQDQLMHNADLALYRSKAQGRGTYHFFERSMQDRAKAASRADITDGQRVRMTGPLRFARDH